MNNEDLKKKICDIIAPYVSAYGDDERIAAALIEAGVVDKSDYASMKETAVKYKAEVSKAESRAKDAEHRAARAERALRDRATYCAMEDMDYFSLTQVAIEARAKELYEGWKREAEKELSEEGEDD